MSQGEKIWILCLVSFWVGMVVDQALERVARYGFLGGIARLFWRRSI
jgi:hypothetical protein